MRAITAAERVVLGQAHHNIYLRIEVADADGAWRDLTALGGVDWVSEATWRASIDEATVSGTVTLAREVGALSLAPLLEASALNRDAGDAYAPLLYPGRAIRITTAVTNPGVPPVAGDWHVVFRGKIDAVDWSGSESQIVLRVRDQGAYLVDTMIETAAVYGSDAGVAVETVMQAIIDAAGLPGGATLVTPVSPGWLLHAYQQQPGSVMEAIRALALQIGWDVRYLFTTGDTCELMFSEPDRARADADATFGPTEYLDVTKLSVEDADVRNAVRVIYTDATDHAVHSVLSESASSVALFGRRYMEIQEDASSNIDTAVEAAAMADAANADLALPSADHEIETQYFWPVQLGDLHTYLANGVHSDGDLTLGVVGYEHRLVGGDGTTTLITRGKPAGAYRDWLRRQRVGSGEESARSPCIISIAFTTNTDSQLGVRVDASVAGSSLLPAVQLVALVSPATLDAGPAIGGYQPSGATWLFDRGYYGTGSGLAHFRAHLNGYEDADYFLPIAPVGAPVVTPMLTIVPGTPTSTEIPLTISCADPSGRPTPPTLTVATTNCSMVISGVTYDDADGAVAIPSGTLVTVNAPPPTQPGTALLTVVAAITGEGSATQVLTIASVPAIPPTVSLQLYSDPGTSPVTVHIEGALGAGVSGHLDWAYRVSTETGTGAWTAWQTATDLPQDVTVALLSKHNILIQARVQQSDGQITESAVLSVLGTMPAIETGSGRVKRSEPMTDGGYAVASSSSDGYTAHTSVKESGGRAVNKLYAKSLPGDPDSLDGVINGTTYGKPKKAALDGSGNIDFGGSGFANKDVDHVGEGSTYKRLPAILSTQMQARTPQATNLLFNPSFDDGLAFWTSVVGTLSAGWDAAKAASGYGYAQLVGAAATDSYYTQSDATGAGKFFRVRPGERYYFGAKAYRESGDATVRARLYSFDKDQSSLGPYFGAGVTSAAWTLSAALFTVPDDGTNYVALYGWIENDGTVATTARFDDFFLTPADAFTQHFDEAGNGTGDLQLDGATVVREGSFSSRVYRHREECTVLGPDTDGDIAVTFVDSYQNTPSVVLKGMAVISYDSTLTGAQTLIVKPVGVTASGFTARAQIATLGATTARNLDFASGNSITAAGGTAESAAVVSGPGTADHYNLNYYVQVVPPTVGHAGLVLAIEAMVYTGSWTEIATFSYGADDGVTNTWSLESQGIDFAGMVAGSQFRLRAKTFSGGGSFTVRGGDGSGSNPETYHGVTYTTSTDTVHSALPSAAQSVQFVATEVI